MDVQSVETMPMPATAVRWDGTREMAWDILEWVRDLTPAQLATDGRRLEKASGRFIEEINGSESKARLHFQNLNLPSLEEGEWLVYEVTFNNKAQFSVYTDDEFHQIFREV